MRSKRQNKRILLILIPLFGLSMLAFVVAPRQGTVAGTSVEESTSTPLSSPYDVDDQKHEEQESQNQEPVVLSIFRFIVNCNPFKKETSL